MRERTHWEKAQLMRGLLVQNFDDAKAMFGLQGPKPPRETRQSPQMIGEDEREMTRQQRLLEEDLYDAPVTTAFTGAEPIRVENNGIIVTVDPKSPRMTPSTFALLPPRSSAEAARKKGKYLGAPQAKSAPTPGSLTGTVEVQTTKLGREVKFAATLGIIIISALAIVAFDVAFGDTVINWAKSTAQPIPELPLRQQQVNENQKIKLNIQPSKPSFLDSVKDQPTIHSIVRKPIELNEEGEPVFPPANLTPGAIPVNEIINEDGTRTLYFTLPSSPSTPSVK